jgi:hypothetical protein
VKRYRRAPRLGTRVTFKPETLFDISYYRGKRLQPGTCGKVALIHGAKGKGVYCDPMNRLVAVRWDSGKMLCVPPKTLVRGCDRAVGCCGLGRRPRGRGERREAREKAIQKRLRKIPETRWPKRPKIRELKRPEGYWASGVPASRHPAAPPTTFLPRAPRTKLTKRMRRDVRFDLD